MATLPLVARNALNFVVFLPGVDTSASNHSQRSSTIMGLPQSTLSITVDGANVQDKYTRSGDGFFANLQPRLDMVEEVTVSSATSGAESSGQGAVQIKFVTRSGTNKFVGSAYAYTRHQNLNTNNYFNTQERPAEERHHPQPVRRARGRSDRDPRRLRRPRQGVLLLQHGAAPLPAEQHADARHPEPAGGAGHLPGTRWAAHSGR